MLRRGLILRSGHGDLFPTSKAAAHLNQTWIMSRPVPHAPGAGHCYAKFTKPEIHSKFQHVQPEVHETKIINTRKPNEASLHHCTTERPSEAFITATLTGVERSLSHHKKTNETPLAQANIAAKKASETRAMTRDFAEHYRGPASPASATPGVIDLAAARTFITDRVNRMRKLENTNPNGYVKEYMIWEPKPPPTPTPAPKK